VADRIAPIRSLLLREITRCRAISRSLRGDTRLVDFSIEGGKGNLQHFGHGALVVAVLPEDLGMCRFRL
jgi:hypothetical protein